MLIKVYEVTYFDEESGRVGSKLIKASSEAQACDKIERMGEYEVIEIEFVDFVG